MTETDVRIVEQNTHFIHYLYELLRLVEEGVPVSTLVTMGMSAENNHTADMERRIADKMQMLCKRYKERCKCLFGVGDYIRCYKGYNEFGETFRVADFTRVENDGYYYDAVILVKDKDDAQLLVVPTDVVNSNYDLIKDGEGKDKA